LPVRPFPIEEPLSFSLILFRHFFFECWRSERGGKFMWPDNERVRAKSPHPTIQPYAPKVPFYSLSLSFFLSFSLSIPPLSLSSISTPRLSFLFNVFLFSILSPLVFLSSPIFLFPFSLFLFGFAPPKWGRACPMWNVPSTLKFCFQFSFSPN